MKRFLGFLPLNVGAVMLVSINMTLALNSLLVNVTEFNPKLPTPWLLCMISNIYTFITWTIVFYGTYKKSILLIKVALNMWIFYTLLWILSALFSLTDNFENYLCVCHRCSESLWLFATELHNLCKINTKLSSISSSNLKTFGDIEKFDITPQPALPVKNSNINSVTSKQDYFDYVTLCVVIVLTNLMLGVITLSNYLIELKCIENCPSKPELITVSNPQVNNRRSMKVKKSKQNICEDRCQNDDL